MSVTGQETLEARSVLKGQAVGEKRYPKGPKASKISFFKKSTAPKAEIHSKLLLEDKENPIKK